MVEGLDRMGYFTKGQKLGLVTFDDPNWRYAAQKALIPALRQRGVSLTDAAYLHRGESPPEYPQTASDANNAVLKFKSDGIDHVIFIGWGTVAEWQFMLAAERQDYHPRYGLSGTTAGQALVSLLGGDARSQLHGAVGISWDPPADVREVDDPMRRNPTRVECWSIMRKAGVDITSDTARIMSLSICDALWWLATALRGASAINQTTFLSNVNALHGGYSPGMVWSTYTSPRQHDGVSSMANMRFVDGCTCFRYISRPYAMP